MLKIIDNFLNGITMYRLVLYFLIIILSFAVAFGFLGILPLNPFSIIFSSLLMVVVSIVSNLVFAKAFGAQTNVESAYITALILALVITPPADLSDSQFLSLAVWASVFSMASKYIFAIHKKHLFNPVALSVALTAISLNQSASWWVGTGSLLPIVIVGGLLVARKVQRFKMITAFIVAAYASTFISYFSENVSLLSIAGKTLTDSALLFFAFIMLTEPLTTPPTVNKQMIYGVVVGILFAPAVHIGSVYSTPELALVVGNILSYLMSPKRRLILTLKEKIPLSRDIYDFVFTSDKKMSFRPGQYLEWTLGHKNPDSRGNRRYFTIASSPTEEEIRLGVKFYEASSSFKKSLLSLNVGDKIIASQLAGDFTLPKDSNKKLVFIAGGIGITPFRSMVKFLVDRLENRDITIFYSNKNIDEPVYRDVFLEAEKNLGIKTVYSVTDAAYPLPEQVVKGRINADIIRKEVPDYHKRTFYISGPQSMVRSFEEVLRGIGVERKQIKKDFFPGFV